MSFTERDAYIKDRSKNRNKKQNNSKSKRKYDKNEGRGKNNMTDYSEDKSAITSKTNDIAWYTHNPALIATASKLPFGNQLGRKLIAADNTGFETVPGLMAIRMVPGPGIASTASDAINIAAMNLFQYVRKNLSTTAAYQPADMMMYVMAMDSLYSNFQFIQRLFNISATFNGRNLYYPNAIFHAQGFDAEGIADLRKNFANYYFRFMILVEKANALYMPADFDIIKRHMWLFANLFVDETSPKAQTYMYVPGGFHYWNEVMDDNGTCLEFKRLNAATFSMGEALDNFESQINYLINSDSQAKITADMKRAFEGRASFSMAVAPVNSIIVPIKDEAALHQIMNAIVHPAYFLTNGNFNVTQDVSHATIIYEPEVDLSGQSANAKNLLDNWSAIVDAGGVILNLYRDDAPDLVIEATRNITVFDLDADQTKVTFRSTGADICTGARVYYMVPDATDDFAFAYTQYYSYSASALDYLKYTHAFNYPNNLYLCSTTALTPIMTPLVNFDNYVQVARENIEMLNDAVMLSLWKVPDFVLAAGKK